MSMILILTYESFIFYRPDKNQTKPVKEVWALLKISEFLLKREEVTDQSGSQCCLQNSAQATPDLARALCHGRGNIHPSSLRGSESETNRRAGQTREGEVKLHLKSRALLERNLRPETSTHLHGGAGRDWPESLLSVGEQMRILPLSERTDH